MVDSHHKNCPLCDESLENKGNSLTAYPEYQNVRHKMMITADRVLLFMTVASSIILAAINWFTFDLRPELWSFMPLVSILAGWVTLKNIFFSRKYVGGKILIQFGLVVIFLLVADIYSGFEKWSTNYVIPFLMMFVTLLLLIIAAARKSLWQDYLGYLLAAFFISLSPLPLYLFGFASIFWTGIAAMLFSLLMLIGMFIFSDKHFKEEMKKRFHS
jgi:hypothetical protein